MHSEPRAMADAVSASPDPDEAAGYLRLRDVADAAVPDRVRGFIAANFDSPLSLLTPQLARLAALGGFRRWDPWCVGSSATTAVCACSHSSRSTPGSRRRARSPLYAVIAYMDTIAGVYFPRGGMRALPDAMAAAAAAAGVEFVYSRRLPSSSARSPGDRGAHHQRRADRRATPWCSPPNARHLPAAVAAHHAAPCGARGAVGGGRACRMPVGPGNEDVAHTTSLFGDAWAQTFRDIIDDGRVMADPSLLVTRPTAGDQRSRRPAATCCTYWCRRPTLESARSIGTPAGRPTSSAYSRSCGRGCSGAAGTAEVLRVTTPADWARQGMAGGHPVRVGAHLCSDRSVPARQTPCEASTTWCWPDRQRCRVSGCRPRCCPAGWPRTAITGLPASETATDRSAGVVRR